MQLRKKTKPYRNGQTLPEYQVRYGIEDGFKRWEKKNKKISYRFSEQYYIEKYGEAIGKKKWEEYCKDMDKVSLKSFIERYGEKEGKDKFEKHSDRLSYSSSIDYYIEKYGEAIGKKKWEECLISKLPKFPNGCSKISQEFCWKIYDKLSLILQKNVYFSELNGEYKFYTGNKKFYIILPDFKLNNKIIEFDGDYWHSLEKTKKRDKFFNRFLKSKGYKIKRVKENDYYKNKNKIINKCIKFLNKN